MVLSIAERSILWQAAVFIQLNKSHMHVVQGNNGVSCPSETCTSCCWHVVVLDLLVMDKLYLYHERLLWQSSTSSKYTSTARWDTKMTGGEPTCDGKTGDVPIY